MDPHPESGLGPVLTALARSAVATSFAPRPPGAATLISAVLNSAGRNGTVPNSAVLNNATPGSTVLDSATPENASPAARNPAQAAGAHAADLARREATFVTLERDGRLRGCIGTLTPLRPLGVDVVRNARLAARDPRLPPVEEAEAEALRVTVTVLTPSEPLAVRAFATLLDHLRPGRDGLTLKDRGGRRATFLPSVWASLPEPERFVAALLRKGRWPRSLWAAELRSAPWPEGLAAERYGAREFAS